MILRIFLLACALVPPSLGKLDMTVFSKKFEDNCFQNTRSEPFKINGQDTPLASTLENFIALAEKLEVANPNIDLKDELFYFINEYVFENIKFVNGKVDVWRLGRATASTAQALWDPVKIQGYAPNIVDPFTQDEKCSLYFMISHSVLTKDKELLRFYSPGNYSFNTNRAYTAELNIDDYYPQELGVVAIRGTDAAVSLSKVLIGLYVGLNNNRYSDITSYEVVKGQEGDIDSELPAERRVDALYATTLAEILVQAKWTGSDRPGFAPNGKWVATQLSSDKSIEGFCPMVYRQQKPTTENIPLPAYSYSSVRGAADGLILGLSVSHVYNRKTNVRLSQILRMYYSPEGISFEETVDELASNRVSFCDREDLVSKTENKLHEQMLLYGFMIAQNYRDVKDSIAVSENSYQKEKSQIYNNLNTEISNYCSRRPSTDKPEDLPRETYLDVLVVLDSSISENAFQEQQMIVGYLAKQLDLRYTGSRMTILLDHKIMPDTAKGSKIDLEAVVFDSYSSSCAACMVGQIAFEPSTVERDEIITAIDQFLQERKENETQYNGVSGKVVVYFNYEQEEGRNGNRKVQGRLEQALRNLHRNHHDMLFYAVGLDSKVLLKYAKFDPALFTLSTDDTHEGVANKIFEKLSYAPALLQYSDCMEGRNERAAVYENFISPHKIQHYEMPAEYFYKSTYISVFFESQNGYVKVCHNRRTMRPENQNYSCKNTTGTAAIEFKISNPCQNFLKETCSPFYFSIMGMDSNPETMRTDTRPRNFCDDINDHWCANLDQIKYKVSHTGIRCSGCLGIAAAPVVILFSLLSTYFIQRRF